MDIAYHSPHACLAPYVSIYGTFIGHGEASLLSLPALLGQIHINLGEPGYYQFGNGRVIATPRVALCGPFNGAFQFLAPADFRFITVGLFAMGWRALARLPASDLADTVIDAACIWSAGRIERLLDRLANCPLDGRHIPIVEAFLREGLSEEGRGFVQASAIDHWLEHSLRLSLDGLGDGLDISMRQAARLTNELHGASPKLLAMKYRALRAATKLAIAGKDAVDDVAQEYADQSHLIRDFRRFIGSTPRQFLQAHSPMARLTIEKRWQAGARRPLALWS